MEIARTRIHISKELLAFGGFIGGAYFGNKTNDPFLTGLCAFTGAKIGEELASCFNNAHLELKVSGNLRFE